MTEYGPLSLFQELKEFVYKFNHDGFDFIENPNAEQQSILNNLGSAVARFEVAKNELDEKFDLSKIGFEVSAYTNRTLKYNIDLAISELNRSIKIAKANNVYMDSKWKKEIEEFKANKAKIEQKIEDLQTVNTKLAEQSIGFRKWLEKIFEEYSEVEVKYGWILDERKLGESKLD